MYGLVVNEINNLVRLVLKNYKWQKVNILTFIFMEPFTLYSVMLFEVCIESRATYVFVD